MDTKIISAELSAELLDRVDELAARLELPRESVLEQALSDWADWEEERHRMTLEGLADVEAGRVVDHESVMAWADSLGTDNPLPIPLPKA
jgi:predicted transcriptional regulator